MQAVILAGGESSRFWPLSENNHKSLIRIMGKPIILWTIESLKRSGLENIVVVENPLDSIEKIIGNGKEFGVSINYVVQEEARGMGNAVMQAENLVNEDFFVINPNYVCVEELIKKMILKKERSRAEMVLLGTKTDKPWNYGILKIENDRVKGIVEKPKKGKEPSNTKVVGIYLIPKEFFDYHRRLKEHTYSYEEVLQKICQESDCRVVATEEVTTTLKYPWDLFGISKKIMDSYLTQGYISKSAKVAKNVIIEGNVWIGDNTRIFENAVIKGPCYIGNNCVIGNFTLVRKYSNIEDNAIVGSHAELSNAIIQEGTHVHNGLFGDSIIGKNCRIGGGTITANRRIDRGEIGSVVKGELINTGLDYFGTVIGDNTRIGICVGTMPGVMIGSNVIIGPQTQVRKNVESNCVYYSQFREIKRKRISDD